MPTLSVTPSAATLDVGSTLQLTVSPSSGGVKWHCSHCSVASVTNGGLVKAITPGTAVITATRGSTTVTVVITVQAVAPTPPPLVPPSVSIQSISGVTVDDEWQISTAGTAAGANDRIVESILDFGDGTSETYAEPPPLAVAHTWAVDATYHLVLSVVTEQGQSGMATLDLIVPPGPTPPDTDPPPTPVPPVAVFQFVSGIYAGRPIAFSTEGSGDADGIIQAYVIQWGDGSSSVGTGAPPVSPSHAYASAGSFTATLAVTDNDNQTVTASVVVQLVTEPTADQPPVAKVAYLQGRYPGDAFLFSTAGSFDPDGDLTSWSFSNGAGQTQSGVGTPPASLSTVYATAASVTASLTLTDSHGLSNTATLPVTILPTPPPIPPIVVPPGDNGYFDALVADSHIWKSYSFRPVAGQPINTPNYANQLLSSGSGGYAGDAPYYITYDPTHDPDPRRQDAAKVVIPGFSTVSGGALTASVDASGQLVTNIGGASLQANSSWKIEDELVTYHKVSGQAAVWLRGQFGTTAAPHVSGTLMYPGVTCLLNQLRPPISLTQGDSWLLTWDAWYGHEWQFATSGIGNQKTFQIASPNTIWYEIRNTFSGAPSAAYVSNANARGYGGPFAPNVTNSDPLKPAVGTFNVRVETWTRYWALTDLRDPTFAYVYLWCADHLTGVVQILDGLGMTLRVGGAQKWWAEYNTSYSTMSAYRAVPGQGELVSYMKNLAVLKAVLPSDVGAYLIAPTV